VAEKRDARLTSAELRAQSAGLTLLPVAFKKTFSE